MAITGVLNLITDRTESDVARVRQIQQKINANTATEEELSEWLGGMRGAYNASDLNRVGAAVEYLANRFNEYGYSVSVTAKHDWSAGDIPTMSAMQTYLQDVSAIRQVFNLSLFPSVPSNMKQLTYQKANNIERILEMVEELINNMITSFFYSGEIYSGEVI